MMKDLYNGDDDQSCVMMAIVGGGLLHDNGHYRRHKGQRAPLEAFIGSFLLTLLLHSDQNFSLSCKTYLHGFWKFLLRFEDNVASEKSELVQINFLIGPVLGSG